MRGEFPYHRGGWPTRTKSGVGEREVCENCGWCLYVGRDRRFWFEKVFSWIFWSSWGAMGILLALRLLAGAP